MEIRHVGAAHTHTAQMGRRMDGLTNLIGAFRNYANAPQNTHKNTSQGVYHTHPGALNDSGKTKRIWKTWNTTQYSRNSIITKTTATTILLNLLATDFFFSNFSTLCI